jgi:hypothetical protein
VFNQARADFERLLTSLRPFADHLADLLETNEPDIYSILDHGDNIVRVVLARKHEIADVVYGLARYTFKFAKAASIEQLPDGSRLGYFKLFIDLTDVRQMLCSILSAPGQPDQMAQLRTALGQANPALSCGAAPPTSAAATNTSAPSGRSGTPAPSASSSTAAPSPAQQRLRQQALDQLARTQHQSSNGVMSDLFGPALAGGS